eukprot:1161350-Pelagomonas_calceolata.AAC.21
MAGARDRVQSAWTKAQLDCTFNASKASKLLDQINTQEKTTKAVRTLPTSIKEKETLTQRAVSLPHRTRRVSGKLPPKHQGGFDQLSIVSDNPESMSG